MASVALRRDRFKRSSRPLPIWPPAVPGYVVLIVARGRSTETAHYCRAEEAEYLSKLLASKADLVEERLNTGESMERIVADFEAVRDVLQRPRKRKR